MFRSSTLLVTFQNFFHLRPGDIIATGTPKWCWCSFLSRQDILAPGDIVDINVEGIGTLTNGVKDEVL